MPLCKFIIKEVKQVIMKEINVKNLIAGKNFKQFSEKCYSTWKVAQLIMILKPEEKEQKKSPHTSLCSYFQFFLEVCMSRGPSVWFRNKQGTIKQVHRLVNQILNLNSKRYCSAAFPAISQAFDKAWHSGLQVKLP